MFNKKFLKLTLAALLGSSVIAGCSASQKNDSDDINDIGVSYYRAGDYQNAITYYTQAAEMGNKYAQANLGYIYKYGKGVDIDYKKSLYFYKLAAEQGHNEGYLGLGYAYENGLGVEPNYSLAAKYYELSETAGGYNNLANLYELGKGVPKDLDKAKAIYKQAIAIKPSYGLPYVGLGDISKVEGDNASAMSYYEQASSAGEGLGFIRTGDIYLNGTGGVVVDPLAAESLYKSAIDAQATDANWAVQEAKVKLALLYETGKGFSSEDKVKAQNLYREVLPVLKNNPEAGFILGLIYRDSPTFKNKQKAREAFKNACKVYNRDACDALKKF